MIDLETLDTTPTSSILTIGAVRFDPFGDELADPKFDKFYVRVDIDSCDQLGLTVNPATIDWWSRQDPEAQSEAFNAENRINIIDAMTQLYQFSWGCKRVWSHGAAFDIPICEHIFKKIGKAVPWEYWQVRCTRTIFDIGINPNQPSTLKHHALNDAWAQAIGVQNVLRTLKMASSTNGKYITPFANTN